METLSIISGAWKVWDTSVHVTWLDATSADYD